MSSLFEKINILIENRKYKNQYKKKIVHRISKYEKKFKLYYKIDLYKKLSLKDIYKLTKINIHQLNTDFKKGGFNLVYKNIILSNNI